MIKHYLYQNYLCLTHWLNVLLGGWADESPSARSHRENIRWAVWFLNKVHFWQKDHCKSSYDNEVRRMHMPPEYRK